MDARRRTEKFLASYPPLSAPSTSSSPSFLHLPAGELASVIFGCTHETYDECVQQLIFGLRQPHFSYIKKIQPGMPLFLFNYHDRKLHGIFEAASQGELNINPYAWSKGSKNTLYSAQVRVRVRCLYQPLSEKVFRCAIEANYYRDKHFYFELNHVQTDMLFSLFARNARLPDGPQMRAQPGAVSQAASSAQMRVQSVAASQSEDGCTELTKVIRRFQDTSQNAPPFVYPPASTLNNQRVATAEHRDDDCGDDAGETTVVEDPQGSVEDLPVEEPFDLRLSNLRMTDNGEEHKRKLRQINYKSLGQDELLRELEELKKKNATLEDTQNQLTKRNETLEHTQVRLAAEFEGLRCDVVRLSHQVQSLLQGEGMGVGFEAVSVREEVEESLQEIYLIGGRNGNTWLGSTDVFYPTACNLVSAAPMLTPRSDAGASLLMGSIYVFGGWNGRLWYETVESYDRERDEWIQCSPMHLRRGGLAGATVGDRIFAIGGGDGEVSFSQVECYDAFIGMWMVSTSMLNQRSGVAAVELNGALYAVGGHNNQHYLQSVERYDPREALWTAVASLNRKRGRLSAVTMGEKIYAIGGYDGIDFLNSVELYEPRKNYWIEMETRMHIGRAYGAAARVGTDLYMFGGVNEGACVDKVERFSDDSGWEVVDEIALGRRCSLSCATLE